MILTKVVFFSYLYIMKLIYFDNAATSHYKPFCVKLAFFKALKISANPGRSGHKLSIKNLNLVYKTRLQVAKHFNVDNENNVIFTKNCTEALNLTLQGICLKKSGNVVVSVLEHNSVLRPLNTLEKNKKITLTKVKPQNKMFITKKDIEEVIRPDTFLVCVGSISNVTGNKNEIEEIGKFCNSKGILFLVDNAQGIGHIKIDMKKHHINFLTFSGHKGFLTPQGIGALCINSNVIPSPILQGGTGTDSESLEQPKYPPESLESGTLATPLICSLFAGIKYSEKNFKKHNKRITELTEYLQARLKEIKDITIYSSMTLSGVVSFTIKDYDSEEISRYLDTNYNIAVRGGLHCAGLTHEFFGTLKSGMVRVSLCHKNTKKEIDTLIKALNEFIQFKT